MNFYNHYYNLFEGGNVRLRKDVDMGGNVVVDNDITADKIPLDKISTKEYNELREEIIQTLKALNKEFESKYKKPLFPNLESNIENGDLFSGSTKLLFTKPHEELKRYKKSIGDIDLQYPEDLRASLKEFLKDNEGKKFGKMIFLGSGGNSIIQFNTIFQSNIGIDLVKNLQFDFEPTQWEKDSPSEFAIFSHYADWKDIQNKVKGAFQKLLMRALVNSKEKLSDIVVMTPTGKISTSVKYDDPSMRKFSVDKGMRVAFEPVLDDKGNVKKTDNRSIYREIDTKKSTYSRDLDDIFSYIFGKKISPVEKQQTYSFIGLLNLMNKYLDKNKIKEIFSKFMEIIWGKNSQEIEQGQFNEKGIQENDFEVKKSAYDQFIKVFPYLKINDKELEIFVMPFYENLKRKKDAK